MKVRAMKDGFDGQKLRREGEFFEWRGLKECPAWCRPVGWKKAAKAEEVEVIEALEVKFESERGGAQEDGVLSDGTSLSDLRTREDVKAYAEEVFGVSLTWGKKDEMLLELVELDRASQAEG